jgi:hypothetical protein
MPRIRAWKVLKLLAPLLIFSVLPEVPRRPLLEEFGSPQGHRHDNVLGRREMIIIP